MKVLLIQAPSRLVGYEFPPSALLYLAGVLEQAGVATDVVDLAWEPNGAEHFVQMGAGRPFDYDLVGITGATAAYRGVQRLAEVVKGMAPGVPIVAGGSHVTFLPDQTLRETPWIDVVVRGEGEETLLELVSAYRDRRPLDAILGITFRRDGEIFSTPNRPLIADLDRIPIPPWHKVDMRRYISPIILASRGCPGQCIFCAANSVHYKYRMRSMEQVIEEIRLLGPYIEASACHQLVFFDNTLSASYRYAWDLAGRMIDAGLHRLGHTYTAELRVDTVDMPLLHRLREAGFGFIHFGLESGNDDVLSGMGKNTTVEQARRAVYAALDTGFWLGLSFTIGHPNDTEESIRATIALMREFAHIRGTKVSPSIITPYPGTRIWRDPQRYGVTICDQRWETYTSTRPVMSTRHLSRQRIGELFAELLIETESVHAVYDWRKSLADTAHPTAATGHTAGGGHE